MRQAYKDLKALQVRLVLQEQQAHKDHKDHRATPAQQALVVCKALTVLPDHRDPPVPQDHKGS